MRRQQIAKIDYRTGYDDSQNPLSGGSGWGEGSCNTLILGDGVIRPHGGFTSKGASTGTQVPSQIGNTWGGLKLQASASGSLIEDFSKKLYAIGAGYLSKEGVTMQAYASTPLTIVLASGTDVAITPTNQFTSIAHGLATGSQIRYTATSSAVIVGLALNTTYFIINTGANIFKLATTWANAQLGTPITITGTGTGNQTFTKGVDMTASSQLKVASSQLSDYLYNYYDTAGLARPDAPTLEVPATVGTNYTGLIDGAISFKVGAIRDRANTAVSLTNVIAEVKSVASTTSAVVVPARKSVKITFPTKVSGQTHWAVFATKIGFGGTGIHYRIGYRTSSLVSATWVWGIPEETVAASSTRTLEFDFRDGDLYPEEAWLFDYVPPQGTHFLRLENVGIVLGCYSGTVGAVSLPNAFESYHPRHLIYFPEPVTAVLSRSVDDFAYVACRNSIHVLQYVGYRGDDYPSCTISTITSEAGIAYQQNWASGLGLICAWIEGSGLVLIRSNGEIDYEFGKEVAYFTRNWTAAAAVISFDPRTRSFVAGNGTSSVSWCVQSGAWGTPTYLTDYSITGDWLSGINSRGELIMTANNAGTHTAYSYDPVTPNAARVLNVSRWQNAGSSARSVNIYEIEASIRQGSISGLKPLIIGIHQNLYKTFIRGCTTSNGVATLTAPAGSFTSTVTGKQAVLIGSAIGGVGIHHLKVTLTYSSGTAATMSGNAEATLSNVLVIIGEDFEVIDTTTSVDSHLYSFYPAIQDCRSFAVSVYQLTDGVTFQVMEVNVFGTQQQTSEAKL